MRVILPMECREAWLTRERSVEELQSFLVPYEARQEGHSSFRADEVSRE